MSKCQCKTPRRKCFNPAKEILKFIKNLGGYMSVLVSRVSRVLSYLLGERQRLLDEVAVLRNQLAEALANDAADAAAILEAREAAEAARVAAEAAAAEAARLQDLVSADAEEDAAIEELLAPVEAEIPAEDLEPEV